MEIIEEVGKRRRSNKKNEKNICIDGNSDVM